MKKLFFASSLVLLLTACSPATDTHNQQDELSSSDVQEPAVVEETFDLSKAFASIPLKYCDDFMRVPVLIYDEENYYIKTGTDLSQDGSNPSYDYCVFTVFKNTAGANDVYGIVKATVTPMYIFGGIEFLEKHDEEWVEVTDEVFAKVDAEEIKKRELESIKTHSPDLIGQGVDGNYYVELPRYGTTLEFIQHNTKEVIYELKWDGAHFVIVD